MEHLELTMWVLLNWPQIAIWLKGKTYFIIVCLWLRWFQIMDSIWKKSFIESMTNTFRINCSKHKNTARKKNYLVNISSVQSVFCGKGLEPVIVVFCTKIIVEWGKKLQCKQSFFIKWFSSETVGRIQRMHTFFLQTNLK